MKEKRSNWVLIALSFLILTLYVHIGDYTLPIGGLDLFYYIPLAMLLVVIAAVAFVISPNIARVQLILKMAGVLLLPIIFILAWSVPIWIIHGSSIAEMRRGIASVSYVISGICAMAALVYLVGERSRMVLLCSILAGCTLTMLEAIKTGGVGAFFKEYIDLVLSFTAKMGPLIYEMELHDAMYALGLYLLVFLVQPEERKKHWWALLLALFFFTAGLKRIAMLAIMVGMVFAVVFAKDKHYPQVSKFLLRLIGVGYVVVAFLFLAISVSGLFEMLEDFGVNTMGRQQISESFEQYYEFSPFFLGNGLGFVDTVGMEMGYHTHNDFLKRFIELGMLGFVIWSYLQFTFQVKQAYKLLDRKGGAIALAMTMFMAVTYTTEMIVAMPLVNSTFALFLLSHNIKQREAEKEAYNLQKSHAYGEFL